MKRAWIAVLLVALAAAACGSNSETKLKAKDGTMAAVDEAFSHLPTATYKVHFLAQGAGLKNITSYWKDGQARIDTVSTTATTRHYVSAKGTLVKCTKQKNGSFDCVTQETSGGFSFGFNAGPTARNERSTAKSAGNRPSTRKIVGQTVDCWKYDATENIIEQETCINHDGVVLYFKGGTRDNPYQGTAVSYTTEVSAADVRTPRARPAQSLVTGFLQGATTTTPTSTTTAP
jgi:hypothetical protein